LYRFNVLAKSSRGVATVHFKDALLQECSAVTCALRLYIRYIMLWASHAPPIGKCSAKRSWVEYPNIECHHHLALIILSSDSSICAVLERFWLGLILVPYASSRLVYLQDQKLGSSPNEGTFQAQKRRDRVSPQLWSNYGSLPPRRTPPRCNKTPFVQAVPAHNI